MAVFLTCVLSVLVNLDSLIHIDHIPKYDKAGRFVFNQCWFKGPRHIYYRFYNQWVLLVTMTIIPFFILICGNVMIICKMIKYKIQRKTMSVGTNSTDAESLTAMLISISLLFLVTQVPAIVVGIVRRRTQDVPRSVNFQYRYYLIDGICKLLKWVNHALNFVCFCIAGRRFREEVVAMVRLCFQKRQLSKPSQDIREVTTAISVSNNI